MLAVFSYFQLALALYVMYKHENGIDLEPAGSQVDNSETIM